VMCRLDMMFALGIYTESMSMDVVVWYSDFKMGKGREREVMRYFCDVQT